MLTDSELSSALRIVKEAVQAEGDSPDVAEDLESLSKLATRHALKLSEHAASIRAAVATLDEWRSECRDAPVVR